jgi:putative ABC transport system ATP-binding protein
VSSSEQYSNYSEKNSYSSLDKNLQFDMGLNSIRYVSNDQHATEGKKTRQEVFDLLKMLSHKFRRTIIMVTHNPDLAQATDRSIHIRNGVEKEVINNN